MAYIHSISKLFNIKDENIILEDKVDTQVVNEYCGRFLPALRFFLPLFAEAFTTPCGEVYQLNLSCS
ncbi:hypothetical protein ACTQ54_12010 [Fundicoccus sp. Sow4_H7]|uniref:hypothetical protein n=1 Tax=Fundicoccus sp. Sow4_H7 TaxID=3438784 RepID=UPI003F8FB00C